MNWPHEQLFAKSLKKDMNERGFSGHFEADKVAVGMWYRCRFDHILGQYSQIEHFHKIIGAFEINAPNYIYDGLALTFEDMGTLSRTWRNGNKDDGDIASLWKYGCSQQYLMREVDVKSRVKEMESHGIKASRFYGNP